MEEAIIDYIDEDGNKRNGHFKIIEETRTGLRIQGNKNILIIPYSKISRVKIKTE